MQLPFVGSTLHDPVGRFRVAIVTDLSGRASVVRVFLPGEVQGAKADDELVSALGAHFRLQIGWLPAACSTGFSGMCGVAFPLFYE